MTDAPARSNDRDAARLGALLAAATLLPAAPAEAGTLYGFSSVFQQVYAIDTTTGAATLVGSLPPGENLGGSPGAGAREICGKVLTAHPCILLPRDRDIVPFRFLGPGVIPIPPAEPLPTEERA